DDDCYSRKSEVGHQILHRKTSLEVLSARRNILFSHPVIRAQFPPESIPSHSQDSRRLLAISTAAFKHPKDVSSLDLRQRKDFLIRRDHLRVGAQKLRGKIRFLDFWLALGQHDGTLHGVLKLANVAGPRIGEQPI